MARTGLTHAQCCAHCRREFIEAERAEPARVAEALRQFRELYEIEARIRARKLDGPAKLDYRRKHAKLLVEAFFAWIEHRFEEQGWLPSTPLTQALAYARKRRAALEVFLNDPDVPIDTNHLERALRPIPLGQRNWLFSWTELGARHIGIVQSLLITCRLHGIDPYVYLVDVLQRVSRHPAAAVAELTPRLWKARFGDQPLRSDLCLAVT